MKTPRLTVMLAVVILVAGGRAGAQTVTLTIRFSNPSSTAVEAKCEADTSKHILKVVQGTRIKWKLKKDDDDKCDFNAEDVTLEFDKDGVSDVNGTSTDPGKIVKGHSHLFGDSAEAIASGPGGPYQYKVKLAGKTAQDPELDIAESERPPVRRP